MKLVTVILPTYNREKTLIRAINSILNQTYKNIELIVIDDNSQDNTIEVLKKINDKRITYIVNKTNKGACFSRNIGIKYAKGDYIAFQDSDDEWYNNKLEKQVDFLEKHGYDLVSCYMNQIYENKKSRIFPKHKVILSEIEEKILFENIFSTQTILGKKMCFIEEKFDIGMPRFQDWELMIRMTRKYKIGFCEDILVDAFIQQDSISRNSIKAIEALKKIKNNYCKDDKSKSYYDRSIGRYYLEVDKRNAKKFFKKAFKSDPLDIKNIVNFLLCKINLTEVLKYLYKLKDKI